MTEKDPITAARRILELSEKATEGPWRADDVFGDWGFPFISTVVTPVDDPSVNDLGIQLRYGGVRQCIRNGQNDALNERSKNDAVLIAETRTLAPIIAQAVIDSDDRAITIKYCRDALITHGMDEAAPLEAQIRRIIENDGELQARIAELEKERNEALKPKLELSKDAIQLAREFADKCNICTFAGIWNLATPVFMELLSLRALLSEAKEALETCKCYGDQEQNFDELKVLSALTRIQEAGL